MKVVHIEWLDSQQEIGWDEASPELYEHDVLTHSIGLLLFETYSYILIAHSYDPETNEFNGRMAIPLCAIKEMRTLCHVNLKRT